jgi:voltage-gated potassium channel
MPRIARPNLIERRMSRFLRQPPSVRTAAGVIVTATAAVVVVGGVSMRVLDHTEYSNIWVGMWWALQTVTTVGYGDVTPKNPSGRIVAVFVMLEGIAFLTIIIAAITSTFIARAELEREVAQDADEDATEQIEARLDRIEQRLDQLDSLGDRRVAALAPLADARRFGWCSAGSLLFREGVEISPANVNAVPDLDLRAPCVWLGNTRLKRRTNCSRLRLRGDGNAFIVASSRSNDNRAP